MWKQGLVQGGRFGFRALAKKFRKRAMETYGYKKGAVKAALEDAMKRFHRLKQG
jgi:hypothetical protein